MVQLPQQPNLVDLIYSIYRQSPPRAHLGASQIGDPCSRKLWLSFRWTKYPEFEPRMLRLFNTGQREELRIIEDLRKAGVEIWDRDGKSQISFSMFGGNFAGSVDGVIRGVPEAPKTPHVLEIKTSNDKSFKLMQKNGVEKTKPVHYAQTQVYMSALKLDRAVYIMVNKNTDQIYSERIHFDKDFAQSLESKAHYIIFTSNPPDKLGESETDFRCKFCEFKCLCWNDNLPEINCRTCCHSSPSEIGGWYCESAKTDISLKIQFLGCDHHIFIPSLVPLEVVDADAEKGTVTYAHLNDAWENGPGAMSSEEFKCSCETTNKPQ